MKTKQLTCITCPAGCRLDVCYARQKIISISGNQCPRGLDFVQKEIFNPVRILTTSITIESKIACRLPVRSKDPVRKDKLPQLIREVKKIKAEAPVKAGDCLAANLLGTGVQIIASQTIDS